MKIAELFAELGFKTNPGEEMKLRDFANVLGDLNMSSIAAAAGLGATGVAIAELAETTANAAQVIRNFHLYTGVPEKDIQQWEHFAETMGVAKGEVDSFFASAKLAIGQMRLTGEGLGLLQALGIDPNEKDPTKRFMQIRRAMRDENIAQETKMALLSRLQMSQGMQALMNLPISDSEFLKRISDQPFMTSEQIDKWSELARTFKQLAIDGGQLFAALTPIADLLDHWLKLIDLVIKGWTALVEVIKTTTPGDYAAMLVPVVNPSVSLAGGGGGRHQTNHFSINITGMTSAEGVVKTIEEVIARVVADAFYQDPGQQR